MPYSLYPSPPDFIAKFISRINNCRHTLEVQLLEERHKEEVRLYQAQLSQNEQQMQNLQTKFQQHQERKVQIAQQLHKVMEAQWIEALKILNNSRSPVLPNSNDFSTIDQLNSLRCQSQINFEELLSLNAKNEPAESDNRPKILKPEGQYNQNNNNNTIDPVDSISSIIEDDGNEGGLRFYQPSEEETPISSRPAKNKKQSEHELQKYIQLVGSYSYYVCK